MLLQIADSPQLSIGTLIGALVAAPLADRVGRRISVTFWSLIVSIGFVIQISADTAWYQVMIGRFIAGLGVGALSLLVPMYQGSYKHPEVVFILTSLSRDRSSLDPRCLDLYISAFHHSWYLPGSMLQFRDV